MQKRPPLHPPSYPPFLGVEIRLKALAEVRFLQKYEQRAIVIRSFIAYLSYIPLHENYALH